MKTKIQKDLDEGKFNRICSNETTLKEYVSKLLAEQKQQIKDLITEEMLICRKENTPTSRLTSLFMKINNLI